MKIRSLILGVMFVACAVGANAQLLGLEVTPAKLETTMQAGASVNIPITVRNGGSNSIHVLASMVDYAVDQKGEYVFTKPGSHPTSLMRWASINPREFDIPSGTSQQVRLSIAVPSAVSIAGEYAGIVFFQTRPERRAANGVGFSARVATKIYDAVPGTVKVDGEVERLSSASSKGGRAYRVLFKNTGNAHVYLSGRIEVRRAGTLVERIALPSQVLVERGGERLLEVTGKRLPPGNYQVIAAVDYGGSKLTGGEIRIDSE